MTIIDETQKLCLSHVHEHVALIDKNNNGVLFTDDFYGTPSCGLIDPNNKWAIVAGKHLTLWTSHDGISKITKFETERFCNIELIRLVDSNTIHILLDPWSQYSSIWQLSISTKVLKKISDFERYRDLPYTKSIKW